MRAILHVDMDAFFASVEQHDRPELRGRPVIVGTRERGVVAAASYEARKYGIHSAMPTFIALQRCPHAQVVHPRLERYREVSIQIFEILEEFTPQIEGVSLDEAYLDVTASSALLGSPVQIAAAIKRRIRERTGLTASVGVAPNKLLAKIASDLRKPDGLCTIAPHEAICLLDPLPVSKLPGIGPKMTARLGSFGIRTIRQLRLAPEGFTGVLFGSQAKRFQGAANGMDTAAVIAGMEEKQIGAEETFASDLFRSEDLRVELANLADRVTWRLRRKGTLATNVTVKVRRSDFTTFTRTRTFRPGSQDTATLFEAAVALLDEWMADQPGASVRLLGFSVSGFILDTQGELFTAESGAGPPLGSKSARSLRLDSALDRIRERYGSDAVFRGGVTSRLGHGTVKPKRL